MRSALDHARELPDWKDGHPDGDARAGAGRPGRDQAQRGAAQGARRRRRDDGRRQGRRLRARAGARRPRPCWRAGRARLGTAFVSEALALRAAGITAPVLSWLITPGEPLDEALHAGRRAVGASDERLLDEIAAAARRTGRTARTHLEADTGMSRGGAPLAAWPGLLRRALELQAEGAVEIAGLWSHFACADIPGHPVDRRAARVVRDGAEAGRAGGRGRSHVIRHLANSAATMTLPRARYDMVRRGIAIYGLSPIPELGDFGLRQAMTLWRGSRWPSGSPEGSGVSYGHLYVTDRETTLALVPLGYADGILRHATGRAEVLAGGRRRTVAGPGLHGPVRDRHGRRPAARGRRGHPVRAGRRGRADRSGVGG